MSVSTSTSTIQYVGDDSTDGLVLNCQKLVAFAGSTPVAQQAVGTLIATSVSVSTTTTAWWFATSSQANALITAVAAIQTALKNLGFSS